MVARLLVTDRFTQRPFDTQHERNTCLFFFFFLSFSRSDHDIALLCSAAKSSSVIFWPGAPSLFARHTPSSPSNSSFFQTSTRALHSSRASSPARQAACLCGEETAIRMLSSAIGTVPSRCIIAMDVRECFSKIVLLIFIIVLRASWPYELYWSSLTGFPPKLSRVVPDVSG